MQMSSQHDLSPPAPSSTRPHQPMKSEEQFLHEPTLAFLESHSDQLRLSSSSTLFVLSLSKLNLNSIGDIGQFRHVRICDLGSNFIETIDALVLNCQQLVKLDLHSNRVRDRHTCGMPTLVYLLSMAFSSRSVDYPTKTVGRKCSP